MLSGPAFPDGKERFIDRGVNASVDIARSDTRRRLTAAIGTLGVQVILACALLFGLKLGHRARRDDTPLAMLTIMPVNRVPPVRTIPARKTIDKPDGKAAPPNLASRATDVVVPRPIVLTPATTLITTAIIPSSGILATSGATDFTGPGTGAGGIGEGNGAGGSGDGQGGGDDVDDGSTPPIHIKGRLKDSDYPQIEGETGISGTVSVRYLVEADGKVSECEITRSSGSRTLDDTTCRLIRERFVFRPSRDRNGHAIPALIVENHTWIIHDEPPQPQR